MAKRTMIYSVHPGVERVQKWVVDLPSKTGRSLEEWLDLVKKKGPQGEPERREWLKKEHGLGTNAAWWIAERAAGKAQNDAPEAYLAEAERYVEDMFAAKKAHLLPIYERLLEMGRALGKDVKFCPCKTMVPFYRNHVFAEVKPATLKRVDPGLALGKTKVPSRSRLVDTGGAAKKDRITHEFELATVADIDDEVGRWLAKAYELDA